MKAFVRQWWPLLGLGLVALVPPFGALLSVRNSTETTSPALQITSAAAVPKLPWTVRVNLTPVPREQLRVAIDGRWEVRLAGSGRVLGTGGRLQPTTATLSSTGIRLGDRVYSATRIEIVPRDESPSVWINDHQYRGRVRILRRPRRRLMAINVVDLEQYVASVVDSEMPATFAHSARQAQAIVARTYVLRQQQTFGRNNEFDVYATTRSQKYLGFQYRSQDGRRLAGESDASRRIARETRGIVCLSNGHLLPAYYSAVCGGRTTAGAEVFSDAADIPTVVCNWCREAELYRWTRRVAVSAVHASVRKFLSARGTSLGTVRLVATQSEDRPGARPSFEIRAAQATVSLSGEEFRTALGASSLPSPHFTMVRESDVYVFEGRGHGHGVGMCQWGASGQGHAGRSCLQILRHYYPHANIVVLVPQ